MSNMVAERIIELRKERGINMAELARQINIPIQTISKWERKERSPHADFIIALCDFFNCTADFLLGRTD